MKRLKGLALIGLTILLTAQATQLLADETTASTTLSSSDEQAGTTETTTSSSATTETSTSIGQSQATTSNSSQTEDNLTIPSVTTSSSTTPSSTSATKQVTQPENASQTQTTLEETHIIYRLYHPQSNTHFYTRSENEYQILAQRGWRQEGIAWTSSTNQGNPVYRLYNSKTNIYAFTLHETEYDKLAANGWKKEGVAFHSYGKQTIYRLYNAKQNKYFYTKSLSEYYLLSLQGWKQEGAAFAALGSTNYFSVDQLKPTANLSIQNTNDKAGTFDIVLSNIYSPTTIDSIRIPVWSETDGQDDIIWYTPTQQADGSYKVTVDKKQHKNALGTYHIHLHYIIKNTNVLITTATTRLNFVPLTLDFTLTTQLTDKNEASITLENVDPRLTELLVPIWSDVNGQDDLVWYKAQKITATTYKVTVPLKKHHFARGLYHVHFYAKNAVGETAGRAETISIEQLPTSLRGPSMQVKYTKEIPGQFNIAIQETAYTKQISFIRVAVWSSAYQSNLYWYTLAPTSNQTTVPIRVNYHKYLAGNYYVHVYIDYADKTTEFRDLGRYYLQSPYSGGIDAVLKTASSFIGVRGGTPQHAQLVIDYNSVTPLPVGYPVKFDDDWCDVFTTVVFQRAGLSHLIGRECGVDRHIQIFKAMGIWNEDGSSTPQPGDIITFNWDESAQPNDGFADHIGIVERVENGRIYTIEGNSLNEVRQRSYAIGDGNIRGFARPHY